MEAGNLGSMASPNDIISTEDLLQRHFLSITCSFIEGVQSIIDIGKSHDDLKPDNVVLKEVNGEVLTKIIDYDLVVPLGDSAPMNDEIYSKWVYTFQHGNAHFRPPERFSTLPKQLTTIEGTYDMWGAATTLWEVAYKYAGVGKGWPQHRFLEAMFARGETNRIMSATRFVNERKAELAFDMGQDNPLGLAIMLINMLLEVNVGKRRNNFEKIIGALDAANGVRLSQHHL